MNGFTFEEIFNDPSSELAEELKHWNVVVEEDKVEMKIKNEEN